MTLSCECEWESEPGDTYFWDVTDYTSIAEHAPLKTRRPRCWSCGDLIGLKDVSIAFLRCKVPEHDVEIAIYGDDGEISIATKYHCEECSDLYFSLDALGFCGQPWENQHGLVTEYADIYGGKQ